MTEATATAAPMTPLLALTLRARAGLMTAAAAFALGFVFIAQYAFGEAPCALCLWQRWPYGAVLGLGALALLTAGRARGLTRLLLGLATLGFAATAGIAIFHVGVEQLWWEGLASCAGGIDIDAATSAQDLRRLFETTVVARCDEPAPLLGLTYPAWNAIYATVCTLGAAVLTLARAPRLY